MSTASSRKVFVNLAVRDLARSVGFFTQLGFRFDPQFTDENAACMIVTDDAYVMLLVETFFQTFTKKELCDATTHVEAILALSAATRQEVDEIAGRALAAGGQASNDPMDQGFMYARSFQDPDGHVWEVIHMDPDAVGR